MDSIHKTVLGVLLIVLGVVLIAPAIPSKLVLAILGFYLIVIGIRLMTRNNYH